MANRKSPNQLKLLADERGLTINMLITQTLLAEQTIRGAAVALGVADNTIRHHMKRMGIELEITQVARLRKISKKAENQPFSDESAGQPAVSR